MHPYEFKIKYSQNIKFETEQNVRSNDFYTRHFFYRCKACSHFGDFYDIFMIFSNMAVDIRLKTITSIFKKE